MIDYIKTILIFINLFLILFTLQVSENIKNNKYINNLYRYDSNIYIDKDTDIDYDFINNTITHLKSNEIYEDFYNRNGKILLTKELEDYNNLNNDASITLGYIDYKKNLIAIAECLDDEKLKGTIYHELGHYFDKRNNSPSKKDEEFKELYNKYKDIYWDYGSHSGYCSTNTAEYFASIYKDYYLYNSHLKNKAPELYNYFKNLIEGGISNEG